MGFSSCSGWICFIFKVSFIGHGIGLEIVEPPIIARNRKDRLEPGMVFALEPKLVYENEFCAGIESVFLVTESGARLISKGRWRCLCVDYGPNSNMLSIKGTGAVWMSGVLV